MNDAPQLLLAHHLKKLRHQLSSFQCVALIIGFGFFVGGRAFPWISTGMA